MTVCVNVQLRFKLGFRCAYNYSHWTTTATQDIAGSEDFIVDDQAGDQ